MERSGQPRLHLRELTAKSCWRVAHSCYSLSFKFLREDFKLGEVLGRERAVGAEKLVAPQSATRGGSQLFMDKVYGRHYDAVRLKTKSFRERKPQPSRKSKSHFQSGVFRCYQVQNEKPYLESSANERQRAQEIYVNVPIRACIGQISLTRPRYLTYRGVAFVKKKEQSEGTT